MAKLVKYRGRSRLFSCYKYVPFNDDTNINKQGHSYNGKDLSSLKLVRSQERMDSMLGNELTKNLRTNQKENAFGRNFSNAIKNVFTDASMCILFMDFCDEGFQETTSLSCEVMGKKTQRKEAKYSFGPCKKLSSKFEKMFYSNKETKSSSKNVSKTTNRMSTSSSTDDISSFTSTESSSSSSSSCASTSRSSSPRMQFPSFHRSRSTNNMQVYDNIREKEIAQHYNKKVGTFSLLICLLVMVFSGKAVAIICTSIWLYFAPRCFKRIDSDEYKKIDQLL